MVGSETKLRVIGRAMQSASESEPGWRRDRQEQPEWPTALIRRMCAALVTWGRSLDRDDVEDMALVLSAAWCMVRACDDTCHKVFQYVTCDDMPALTSTIRKTNAIIERMLRDIGAGLPDPPQCDNPMCCNLQDVSNMRVMERPVACDCGCPSSTSDGGGCPRRFCSEKCMRAAWARTHGGVRARLT